MEPDESLEDLAAFGIDGHDFYEPQNPRGSGPERLLPGDVIHVPETGAEGAVFTIFQNLTGGHYVGIQGHQVLYPLSITEVVRSATQPQRWDMPYLQDHIEVVDMEHPRFADTGPIIGISWQPAEYTILSRPMFDVLRTEEGLDRADSILSRLLFRAGARQVAPYRPEP